MLSAASLSLEQLRESYPKLRAVERAADSDEFNRQRYLSRISIERTIRWSIFVCIVTILSSVLVFWSTHEPGASFNGFYKVRLVLSIEWLAWSIIRVISQEKEYDFIVPTTADAYVNTRFDLGENKVFAYVAGCLMAIIILWVFIAIAPDNTNYVTFIAINNADSDLSASAKVVAITAISGPSTVLLLSASVGIIKYRLKTRGAIW